MQNLLTQSVRGCDVNTQFVRVCLNESIEDTVVLAFHIRDIREGMGERKLFRDMIRIILEELPQLAKAIIPHIPVYGRWDDVWSLFGICEMVDEIVNRTVLEQFQFDQESFEPSRLAKWLPREGRPYSLHFANLLFPLTPIENGQRLRIYRKTVAFLNRLLNTTEIQMCERKWSSISPEKVPKQLMKRNKNAFLNITPVVIRGQVIRVEERFSDEDRAKCASNFQQSYSQGFKPIIDKSLGEILDSPRYNPVRLGLKECYT